MKSIKTFVLVPLLLETVFIGPADNQPVSCVVVLSRDRDTISTVKLGSLIINNIKKGDIGSENVNIGNL